MFICTKCGGKNMHIIDTTDIGYNPVRKICKCYDSPPSDSTAKYFNHYQKAINKIDDLFEYRYAWLSKDELKKEVMGIIDEITESIK